jgi:predicted DNA-binding WGR domain protein
VWSGVFASPWQAHHGGRAMVDAHSPIQQVAFLRRIEPEGNVARFYALLIERDLFGHVVLVRRWGRIGSRGRERADVYASTTEAVAAMEKLAAAKRRRGYQDL